MEIQRLLKPFEIEYLESEECPCKPHKHTFFEMVFIRKGKGSYFLGKNRYNYRENDLFIIVPNDGHYTVVSELTGFLFIRFNKIYLDSDSGYHPLSGIPGNSARKIEMIFANQPIRPLLPGSKYKNLLLALFDTLANDSSAGGSNDALHQHLINTLLTIISSYDSGKGESKSDEGLPLLHYIHENIYDPEKIIASSIADHFNISKTYVSEYFKKHTGASMQRYILEYKIALAEIRLKHSDMKVNEIAFELGFTDESHFSKTFKKLKRQSPSQFKKSMALAPDLH